MFVARIELKIQPSSWEAFEAYAKHAVPAARALPGCSEYAFCRDVADPDRVLLYEEWESRASFEAYKASPVFAAAGTGLRPLLSSPPRSAYYESPDLFPPRSAAPADAGNRT